MNFGRLLYGPTVRGSRGCSKAWAINWPGLRERWPRFHSVPFLGVGCFGWPPIESTHLWGNTTALFETRREARIAAHDARTDGYAGARAVRVTVTIRETR